MKQEQPPGDMGLNEIQVLVSHLSASRFIWLLGRQNHLLKKHGIQSLLEETHFLSLSCPSDEWRVRSEEKEKRNHALMHCDCLQETADSLKKVQNLRIQQRITVPVTGWGSNHTTTTL
ncbi:psychosine receptor isoform X3 [Lynx rufus]|uniref:psychosine receptor isoform X3 n=1 Tax=Lynx rufus TaxID=61384 RepID=UPI001F12620B|nr:psychosine receptor isoform X3 [Lynx rufus]XP_046936220.1 psychosine receptor isoform X3 [Lynx rufus]